VTDQNNTTWRNIQWDENVSHQEENPNFYFPVYDDIYVASYMYPSYDSIENPCFWEAVGENPIQSQSGFLKKYAKLTTIKKLDVVLPTTEQRISFAILCAMNLVLNPIFRNWAIQYLQGKDQTKETAHLVSEELSNLDWSKVPANHQYVECAYIVLAAVMLDQPAEFAANVGHRAYYDSLDLSNPINLNMVAQIASFVNPVEISQILE
jgi:hypothetical protein